MYFFVSEQQVGFKNRNHIPVKYKKFFKLETKRYQLNPNRQGTICTVTITQHIQKTKISNQIQS